MCQNIHSCTEEKQRKENFTKLWVTIINSDLATQKLPKRVDKVVVKAGGC